MQLKKNSKVLGLVSLLLVAVLPSLVGVTPAQANNGALIPTFGAMESSAGTFAVPITNHDPAFTWSATASDCATATIENGWLRVSNILPGQTVKARVFTTRTGYDDGMATVAGTSASGLSTPVHLSGLNTSGWVEGTSTDNSGNLYSIRYDALGGSVDLDMSSDDGRSWTTIKSAATTSPRKAPSVATGSNGLIAIAWQTGSVQSFYQVNVSVSRDSGATWTDSAVSVVGNSDLPKIGITASGKITVIWQQVISSAFQIMESRSLDFGATWSAPIAISSSGFGAYGPQLVATSDGDLVGVWGNSAKFESAEYDDLTGTWGATADVLAPSSVVSSLVLAADNDAGVWAAWRQGPSDSSRSVPVSRFDGASWSASTSPIASAGSYSEVAITAAHGQTAVGWLDSSATFKVSTTPQGAVNWSTPTTVVNSANTLWRIGLAQRNASEYYANWQRQSPSPANYYHPEYAVSSDSGSTWGSPVQVGTATINNYGGQLLVSSDDAVVMLWQHQNPYQRPVSATILATSNYSDPREIYQVAEINPGASNAQIYDMALLNGKLYVVGKSDTTGYELFEYDGTNLRLVEDLYPGIGNGVYDTGFVAKTASAIYFQGTDGVTGYELYKFDGSNISLAFEFDPAQTTVDQTSNQLLPGSSPGSDGNSAVLGNLLFLNANYPSSSTGYVIDLTATPLAPQKLTDYFAGFAVSSFYSPIVIGSNLYYRGGSTIYQTDGTATPTAVPGTAGLNHFSVGQFDGKLLIGASPVGNTTNVELLVWDPSDPTTPAALAANINTYNTGGEAGSYPVGFATRCNEVYFTASSGFSGVIDNREMWKWDGYEATLAQDFWPGASASSSGRPFSITSLGEEIFTFANDGTHGTEPWVLRGSQAEMLEDFNPGSSGSTSGSPPMFAWNETLYLPLWGATGIELYAYGIKPSGFTVASYSPTYTITYDPNGGTGSQTQSTSAGSVTLDSGTGFSMTGKVLLGWDTDNLATSPTYAASDAYTLSANVTLYAIWGDVPATPTSEPLPTLILPSGPVTGTSGGDVEFKGSGLGSVTKAEIGDQDSQIKSKSDTSIKVGVPKLDAGVYDLKLTAGSGQLSIQGAVRVVSGSASLTEGTLSKIAAWTKINTSKTKVSIFAKEPVGLGKFEFLHNGKVIRWARAVDASDPKLALRGDARYLFRTQALVRGQNRFEVKVDGKRVWFASYSSGL